jgi:hypothetical protein
MPFATTGLRFAIALEHDDLALRALPLLLQEDSHRARHDASRDG